MNRRLVLPLVVFLAGALALAAAAILMITMGARQSMGLFVSPINSATGLGVVTISFAMAIGQFMWGAAQPVAGAIADRWGPGRVLVGGTLVMAAVLLSALDTDRRSQNFRRYTTKS